MLLTLDRTVNYMKTASLLLHTATSRGAVQSTPQFAGFNGAASIDWALLWSWLPRPIQRRSLVRPIGIDGKTGWQVTAAGGAGQYFGSYAGFRGDPGRWHLGGPGSRKA